jgi:hypothetical protein
MSNATPMSKGFFGHDPVTPGMPTWKRRNRQGFWRDERDARDSQTRAFPGSAGPAAIRRPALHQEAGISNGVGFEVTFRNSPD